MPEDRSFFYKYGLMILAFRMQSEKFFGVMNESKIFAKPTMTTLLLKRYAQDVKGERKGYQLYTKHKRAFTLTAIKMLSLLQISENLKTP